jgi:hypothetical protein
MFEGLKTPSLGDYLAGESIGRLDPYLLSIVLGELGAAFSEEGSWGQKLGGTVAGLSRGVKYARAASKEKEEEREFRDALFKLLAGGLTPKEQIGPTSLKLGPDKATLEMTTPSEMSLAGPGGPKREGGMGREPSGMASPMLRGFLGDYLGPW